ncbi:MAG: adenosylcobinamide-phosphate synthase CbiB [Gammaproteobacteria bacterium]
MLVSAGIILAIALDLWLGEPKHGHPLVAFGRYTLWLERRLLDDDKYSGFRKQQKSAGILALVLAVGPISLLAYWIGQLPYLDSFLGPVLLYLCLGANSLKQHAAAVYQALQDKDIPLARSRVGMIVSRETEQMDALAIRRATIESVLENGADAIFAPLFWYVIAGPTGAVLYRLSNTLDAMWGYKNVRYREFGWAAARLDDLLNWIPARMTASSYALLGQTRIALSCWQRQAVLLESPNAGPVMTAGAGALNLTLGGPARYHGTLKDKPFFGGSKTPEDTDIARANRLLELTMGFWAVLLLVGDGLA